jgi:hypothetical protein
MEKLELLKTLMIAGVICGTGGIILSVLLKMPLLKYVGIILGVVVIAGGVLYIFAGDKFQSKFSQQMTPEERHQLNTQKMYDMNIKLKQEEMNTLIKVQQARQQELQNKIDLQRANINRITKASGNSGSMPDILGNLSDVVGNNKRLKDGGNGYTMKLRKQPGQVGQMDVIRKSQAPNIVYVQQPVYAQKKKKPKVRTQRNNDLVSDADFFR